MTQISESATSSNENIYERLISLIEDNQEQLTLIIVSCDDLRLRQRMIDRYEQEAKQSQIQSHRIVLGIEPSLRAGLAKLGLPPGEQVVVTVTGAEWLLRVKTRSIDEQSDLDKFFGYLQWTREGLREFRYPIVLWVTYPILQEMSRRAPDFWSWRKAVLRFAAEEEVAESIEPVEREYSPLPLIDRRNDDFLPPPAEIISEIQQLAARDPESANLPVLYQKLAGIYAERIARGEATNLEQEQQQAIEAFETVIDQYRKLNKLSALAIALNNFGDFLRAMSRYEEAISFYRSSLDICREIGDQNCEGASLCSLGAIYRLLGQFQIAIDFYQQSLEISRKIVNRHGEGTNLGNLGLMYSSLGQYQLAINVHQQSLEIFRVIGDRYGEGATLCNLGNIYRLLEQPQRAIDFYQQSVEIQRKIGNRYGEAGSLFNLAIALTKYEPDGHAALEKFKTARAIFLELNLDKSVERCDEEIDKFNTTITPE